MIHKVSKIYCAIAMSLTISANAHADIIEDTFRDFSSCDAKIFQTLNRETDTWKSIADLDSRGNYSWIKVKNRFDENENYVNFTKQPTLNGLTVLSYFDETTDLDSMGLYYYWGFTVSGQVEDVVQKLKPLIFNGARLRNVDGAYVHTEIKVPGSRWMSLATNSNTPTGVHKIERVFLIEQHEARKDAVRVSCSLQGGVTAEVLKEIRPDIDPKDFPKRVSIATFDEVIIPENVAKVVRSSTWLPKFRKLSYTYVSKKSDSSGADPVTVEMEAQNGLVRVKEIYSPSFNVQRLMLAGLVQLKSRINGIGENRVYLTTDLKMSLPAVLNKGAKLNTFEVMSAQPQKMGDKESQVSLLCDVDEEFSAEKIFPALTGRAYKLSCISGKTNSLSTRAFLEDLGIAVTLYSKSEFGEGTYQFKQFEIER